MATVKPSFEAWMFKVNRSVEMRIGVSIYDLPDQTYRAWYDDDVTPREAATMVIEEAF